MTDDGNSGPIIIFMFYYLVTDYKKYNNFSY